MSSAWCPFIQVCLRLARWCVKLFFHCLEALGSWMGGTRQDWIAMGFGVCWRLALFGSEKGSALQTEHNFGVHVDSQLLPEEQVAVAARRDFVQLHLVHQLYPFLDQKALIILTHTLVIFHRTTTICSIWGCSWRHLDDASGPECDGVGGYGLATFNCHHIDGIGSQQPPLCNSRC